MGIFQTEGNAQERNEAYEKAKVYDGFKFHCQKSLNGEKKYKFGL